jgi:hypothetical protein
MRRLLLPIVLTIGLQSTHAIAEPETWLVKEGVEGEFHGVWTVTVGNDELSGFAQMFNAEGEPLTYTFSGKRVEDEFVVERESPSNGIICSYRLKNTPQDTDGPLPISAPSTCNEKDQLWLASKIPEQDNEAN